VTELVPPKVVDQGQAEVQEWVDLEEDGGVAPEQAQALVENACVQNAEPPFLMK
jgi:hypothetical protein